MRLLRRTLRDIRIAHRVCIEDELGGVREGFGTPAPAVRGSIEYIANTLGSAINSMGTGMYGVYRRKALRIRFAALTEIEVGDGVMLPGENSVMWRCVQVDAYPWIKVVRVEQIAGEDG